MLINTLYYLDFLFAVAEKAGLEANRRLMRLIGGVPGLAHHELPEYLKELDTLRDQRGGLAWMTNATAGLVRVTVGLAASVALLATLQPGPAPAPLLRLRLLLGGAEGAGPAARRRRGHGGGRAPAAAPLRAGHLGRAGQGAAGLRPAGGADRPPPRERRGGHPPARPGGLAGRRAVPAGGPAVPDRVPGRHRPGALAGAPGPGHGGGRGAHRRPRGRDGWRGQHRRRLRHHVPVLPAGGAALPLAGRLLRPAAAGPAPGPRTREGPASPPQRLARGIELRDVTFRYPGTDGPGPAAGPILDRVSLDLPAGSVVALVGENGAGKTTLVKLLCPLLRAGRRGDPARRHRPAAHPGGGLARSAPAPRSRTSLASSCSPARRWASATCPTSRTPRPSKRPCPRGGGGRPAGPPAGPGDAAGQGLGGGRSSPAGSGRSWPWAGDDALPAVTGRLRRAHLGPRSADRARPVRAHRRGRSRRQERRRDGHVLVSHRFSTVRMADLIVVLDGGRIREEGTHQELLRRGGPYAELYRLQSRAYR